MKKLLSVFLTVILLLGTVSCGTKPTVTPTTEQVISATDPLSSQVEVTVPSTEAIAEPSPTSATDAEPAESILPVGTVLFGLDLGGMSLEAAKSVCLDAIDCYRLTLTVNKKSMTFTASDLQLSLSEPAFESWFTATAEGTPDGSSGLLIFSVNSVNTAVTGKFGQTLKNATVAYNHNAKRFVTQKDQEGIAVDTTPATQAAKEAIRTLSPTASATVTTKKTAPTVTLTDPRLNTAVMDANAYLDLNLIYIFEAPGVSRASVTLTKDTLASFITISDDFQVKIDTGAVELYANSLAAKYGGNKRTDSFISTYGQVIPSRQVEYYGAVVDKAALYADILDCLTNKRSETRTAVYLSAETAALPYGGNYVEVSIADQYLWVYKDGKIVVSTPIVSGNVSSGAWTGGGVFSIYEKDTDCWLVGKTFRDFVSYWIAFNGNIGIHDASWRSEFGGDIYKYNGSHGCVNLPVSIAGQVYANVSVGTKVIVHSVVSSAPAMTQELTGTNSYTLTTQSAPFTLDVTAKYIATEITYHSSDESVVTVDEWGVVRVTGAGNAVITVHSEKVGVLSSANFTVSITVEPPATPEPEPEIS